VTTLPTSKYYECDGTYLLGGYDWKPTGSQLNEFFSRQYTDLPPHKTIVYSFTIWNIGSWDLSGHPITNEPDRIQFQFDNLPVIEGYQDPIWTGTEVRPGNKILGRIAHTSSSLLLKFISQLDEDSLNESFGIRDIKLIFTDETLGADYQCAFSWDGLPFQSQVMCPCSSSQYQSAATSACTSCDSACVSCFGSGPENCYECAEDFYFDGTACTACDSSCSDCIGSGANQCISCSSGYVLFNGVCIEEKSETIETVSAVFNGFLGVSLIGTLALGTTASLWSIISFQQFVGYFIYINVEYPNSTKAFLQFLQTSFWDYLPNPLSSLLKSISEKITQEGEDLAPYYNPPKKFIENEMTSFFIENGGTEISFNLYSIMLLLLMVLLIKKIKSLNKKPILIKIKVHLRWNFIMRTFLEGGIPLCLSIFLQFRVASFRKAYLTVATTLAILSAIYVFIMFLFICTKLYYRDNQHLDQDHVRLMYETLYEGINLSKPYSKCYYLVILVRGCLLTCLIAFLEFSPILQIVPLILFNVFLIYYMLKQVTFTNKKLDLIFKLKEVFILIGECCILCLCFEEKSQNHYKKLGYITVFFLATPLAIEVIYMLILQIYEIKKIYLKIKEAVSKGYKTIFGNGEDQRRITAQIAPERTLVTSPTRRVKIKRRNDPSFAIPSENSEMNIITDLS